MLYVFMRLQQATTVFVLYSNNTVNKEYLKGETAASTFFPPVLQCGDYNYITTGSLVC